MKNTYVSRRRFLSGTVGAIGAFGLTGRKARGNVQQSSSSGKSRPNLLFVFSDQQSWDMLGCYGNEQIITPNIDKVAQEGVRFNYCISNTPVCTPMRGMLMSGQHPLYNGSFANDIQMLTDNGMTFGESLKEAGYRTAYVGKWHLYGGPRPRPIPAGKHRYGFDDLFLSNNCTLDFRPEHAFYYDDDGKKVIFDEWEAYGQARQAAKYISGLEADDNFAMFVSLHPPHDQGASPNGRRYKTEPDLMALYDRDKIRLRSSVEEKASIRDDYHGHMAMCTGVDKAFGMLIDTLKEKGVYDNTIIVYTSDHGDQLGSHGRPWAKSFPEDPSIRVPLIVRWPEKIKPGQVSDLPVGTFDFMPTILGMMDIDIPETCQGLDLSKDILEGLEDAVESVPLFYFHPGWRGVFTKRYTYAFDEFDRNDYTTEWFGRREKVSWNVLYDRQNDPHQLVNLFESEAHAAIRERLHKLTQAWMDKFNDHEIRAHKIYEACGLGMTKLDKKGSDGVLGGRPVDFLNKGRVK